jgi:MFS family permease
MRACGFISLFLLTAATLLIHRRLPLKKFQPLGHIWYQFKDTNFTLLIVGISIGGWGMFTPFFYLTTRALGLGAASTLAAATISFLNAGSTFGRLFAFLGDYLGHTNMMCVGSMLTTTSLLAFWLPLNSVPALIAFAIIYGFLAGFVISLCPSAIAHISPPTEIGARVGLCYALVAIFALTGPPINGALIASQNQSREGYIYSAAFSGGSVAIGLVITIMARFKIAKGKLWAKV